MVAPGCDSRDQPERSISRIRLSFVNNTDALLCYFYGSVESALRASGCGSPITPEDTTTWAPDCYSLTETSPVVLIEDATRDVIYSRRATCGEWIDADLTITIDKDGGTFAVTDQFPRETRS